MNRGIKKGLLLFAGCCMAAGLPDRALAASYNDDTADSYLSRIYTEAGLDIRGRGRGRIQRTGGGADRSGGGQRFGGSQDT